jgi:dihydrofolate reductase
MIPLLYQKSSNPNPALPCYTASMRKIVLFLHLSLDGYSATKEGGLEWIPYNEGFEKYAQKMVATVGSAMYGRNTFEMMKQYWRPMLHDSSASAHESAHAQWIEKIEKIVFSTTLTNEDWNNTRIISGNIVEEVTKLKEQEGKDLVIFGSPTLATSLMELGLIDEFQFTISPVILGEGKTFLRNITKKVALELLSSETMRSGVIAVHYRVVR